MAFYICLAMIGLTMLDRIENPGPNYSEYLNSLRVLDSQMNWAKTGGDLRLYITGILTNQSAVAWRDIELECRFFDANGGLVDAAHPHAGLTIQPHDDSAFRAVVTPSRATNDYASFKISVSTARNTKGWF